MPPVVRGLIFASVIAFFGQSALMPQESMNLLALHIWGAANFAPYQILTHMFMHANLAHLFFNMLALYMFGSILEVVWGARRFLTYYLVTGIGAAFLYMATAYIELRPTLQATDSFWEQPAPDNIDALNQSEYIQMSIAFSCVEQPEGAICVGADTFFQNLAILSETPEDRRTSNQVAAYLSEIRPYILDVHRAVGASGAIFGLLLAFGVLFPNQILRIYFVVPIKAKYFVVLYGALELYMGLRNSPGDNVAHFAHLGGMLFGIILLYQWGYLRRRK